MKTSKWKSGWTNKPAVVFYFIKSIYRITTFFSKHCIALVWLWVRWTLFFTFFGDTSGDWFCKSYLSLVFVTYSSLFCHLKIPFSFHLCWWFFLQSCPVLYVLAQKSGWNCEITFHISNFFFSSSQLLRSYAWYFIGRYNILFFSFWKKLKFWILQIKGYKNPRILVWTLIYMD